MKKKSDEVKAWEEGQLACWMCDYPNQQRHHPDRFRLETHHIVRGVHRGKATNRLCTLMRVCNEHHEKYLDGMPIVVQLAIKQMFDPVHYDRVAVNVLRCRQPEAITQDEVDAAVEALEVMRRFMKEVSA